MQMKTYANDQNWEDITDQEHLSSLLEPDQEGTCQHSHSISIEHHIHYNGKIP
jgi:hypothetical protein